MRRCYLAPEVLQSDSYAEPADAWGAGCIAFEAITLCFLWDRKGMLAVQVMRCDNWGVMHAFPRPCMHTAPDIVLVNMHACDMQMGKHRVVEKLVLFAVMNNTCTSGDVLVGACTPASD